MSHETFKVGEIALHKPRNPGAIGRRHIGAEVEVIGPLREASDLCDGVAYIVRSSNGDVFRACPSALRKRRPPQDWVRIANLTSLPQTVEVLCD